MTGIDIYNILKKVKIIFEILRGGDVMEYCCEKPERIRGSKSREHSYLLTNGLGGYSSLTGAFSAPRGDQGLLVASVYAPGQRINLVHRLREQLTIGEETIYLSVQEFADGTPAERGDQYLSRFSFEQRPEWVYQIGSLCVKRNCAIGYGENTAAVYYDIQNDENRDCVLEVTPFFKFAPKEYALREKKAMYLQDRCVVCEGQRVYIRTNGRVEQMPVLWQWLAYPEDAKDGREEKGLAGSCCRILCHIPGDAHVEFELVFGDEYEPPSFASIAEQQDGRAQSLLAKCELNDPVARRLALGADCYLSRRESTAGMTIVAGYPLFGDWGRDTMIALPGCALSTCRLEEARSILSTFLSYEKDGLLPNMFPERGEDPLYNTVDAALLFVDCLWQYASRSEDWAFAREAWPVLVRIISAYQRGTLHSIHMDEDGLISAGGGMDQVTWMDVSINGVLPTPRHGKPVEVNAYWYTALRTMVDLGKRFGYDTEEYTSLADKVKAAFRKEFYMPQKGYLKDVISHTEADEQIRCNQIWALSQRYSILELEEELRILDTVADCLLTPFGLRTLSPEDPAYHGSYGGSQFQRDMAYHQGTVWVYPLGAYCRAYLRIHGSTLEAARQVRRILSNIPCMLQQGCVGQLPEIYDGTMPGEGKGCFAQAWSVGEILRVYEELHRIESGEVHT